MHVYAESIAWFLLPSHWEVAVVASVILLVLFSRRIPGAMLTFGRSITQFRRGLGDPPPGGRGDADSSKSGADGGASGPDES